MHMAFIVLTIIHTCVPPCKQCTSVTRITLKYNTGRERKKRHQKKAKKKAEKLINDEMPRNSDTPLLGKDVFQAPKLRQEEFGALENNSLKNELRTPPMLTIPSFVDTDVNLLPTPMTYGPHSPVCLRSPVDQHPLFIPKKRIVPGKKVDNALKSDLLATPTTLDVNQAGTNTKTRIISEYVPHSSRNTVVAHAASRAQRVASLPGVDENLEVKLESQEADKSKGHSATFDKDLTITGYDIDHPGETVKLKKIKLIGSGNFSDVYLYEALGESRSHFAQVAVKHIRYPSELVNAPNPDSPSYKDTLSRLESSLTRELDVLKSISHPCIIKLYAINDLKFFETKRPLSSRKHGDKGFLPPCDMVMSYCSGGDLFDMASKNKLPQWLIQRIFAELTMGMKYLHENLIIHRDLKLENVLLKLPLEQILAMKDAPLFKRQNLIELGDFGLCKKIQPDEMCTTRCGSEDYVSPEILMGLPYDGRLSDAWALGVILYALLEDRLPFDPLPSHASHTRKRPRSTAHRIARYEWRWVKLLNDTEQEAAKEIVEHCLVRKIERWDVFKISQSTYVKTVISELKF